MPLRDGRDGSYTCLLTGQLLHPTYAPMARVTSEGSTSPLRAGLVLGGRILGAAAFIFRFPKPLKLAAAGLAHSVIPHETVDDRQDLGRLKPGPVFSPDGV